MHKYYTSDETLKLKEYGRNIQNMVAYAKKLKDDRERNALVYDIIRIMTLLNPGLKEIPDYKQKLWDHLYFLADFDLKVDSEYPIPKPELVNSRPAKRMDYYSHNSRFRQYGHIIELLVEKAIEMKDMQERKALVNVICNMMKINIKGNDRDSTVEDTVMEHLNVLSNGKLRFKPEEITFSKNIASPLAGQVTTFGKPVTRNYGQQSRPGFQQKKFQFNNKKKFKK